MNEQRMTLSQKSLLVLALAWVLTAGVSVGYWQGASMARIEDENAIRSRFASVEQTTQNLAEVWSETCERVAECEERLGIDWQGNNEAPDNTPLD